MVFGENGEGVCIPHRGGMSRMTYIVSASAQKTKFVRTIIELSTQRASNIQIHTCKGSGIGEHVIKRGLNCFWNYRGLQPPQLLFLLCKSYSQKILPPDAHTPRLSTRQG